MRCKCDDLCEGRCASAVQAIAFARLLGKRVGDDTANDIKRRVLHRL
jgi:hypothetical protein